MMQNLIRDIEARIKENSERSEFNEKQERWSEADFYAGKASAFGDVKILIEKTHKENEVNPGVTTIADYYGLESQKSKCIEELHELIEAIESGSRGHTAEEIADVEVMLEQIKYLWDFEATVNQVKAFKIQRQLGRIADGDKPVLSNKTDRVESPRHYKLDGLNLESIDVIKAVLGADGFKKFCRGNTLKYLIRADKKNGSEDLKKARVYLNWEIEYGCDN